MGSAEGLARVPYPVLPLVAILLLRLSGFGRGCDVSSGD